ncbi:hypothetical protein ACGC1H_005387 [Rhizoctonia solani]
MEMQIEDELRDTIFHDPKFVERFLCGDKDKLHAINEHCRANDPHYDNTERWSFPESFSDERQLYQPIVNILNTIKKAVDDVHGFPSSLVSQSDDNPSEPEPFLDKHLSAIDSDLANTSHIKPDLVLFQDEHRHWETVRMPIEVKRLSGHHKAGMKQLSRYARAVFAHQLYRRHLYAIMVCGREATFVRFDRAGILYSGRIDIVEQSKLFTHALASLLMLDRIDEGLDPAFTFRRNQKGRLVYYIDLPESELAKLSVDPASSKSKSSTHNERMRRFEVVEQLCHRQSICGRATIVLRIREIVDHEQAKARGKGKTRTSTVRKPQEYALKLIWRDPERDSEGDVLRQVDGMFGLAQYAGHWDVSMPGKCRCPTPVEGRCKDVKCTDKTVAVDGLEVCDKLRDISILVPEDEGKEQEPVEVDTTECRATSYVRQLRIYSYLLMSSIGIPLWRAESPRRFLTAVLDAVLGYWGLFNLGIMHRDISDGNVLMLDEVPEPDRNEWREYREEGPGPQAKALFESDKILREVLENLGHRDPTGMLSDFDLHARHSSPSNIAESAKPASISGPTTRFTRRRNEDDGSNANGVKRRKSNSQRSVPVRQEGRLYSELGEENRKPRLIDYRTGTPAFMSTTVLAVKKGRRYNHSFLDDLQSFFWLILWSAAAHLDDDQDRPTADAQKVLNKMNRSDFESICEWKSQLLGYCARDPDSVIDTLNGFDNEWGTSGMFQHVLLRLGTFLDEATYVKTRGELESSPGCTLFRFVEIIQDALRYEN